MKLALAGAINEPGFAMLNPSHRRHEAPKASGVTDASLDRLLYDNQSDRLSNETEANKCQNKPTRLNNRPLAQRARGS